MDYQYLYNEIMANPTLSGLAVTNDMPKQDASDKDKQIADLLNQQTEVVNTFITELDLLRELGPVTASNILDKLDTLGETNSYMRRALRALYSDRGLNFGNVQFRASIDSITDDTNPVLLTTTEANLIKNLAVKNRNVTAVQVSIALRGNNQFTPVVS